MLSAGTSNTGLTLVMVVLALVCAAAAVLVLVHYRKRVRNLKREIAHVHYHADPGAQTGTSNTGLTLVMVVLALVCAAAAVLVLVHYRKRVRNLKREIAHVHYHADPGAQTEQQHFDNPVYSYQGSTRGDDSTTLLNNGAPVFNNLNKVNNATLEKLRMRATGSSETYDPLSHLKNKDADATNPNLYHCIDDDNKLDHVYDEIKHKEGFEMEYDHLNYTPPANKWKPHYHSLANGFTVPNNNQTAATAAAASRDVTPTPPIPPLPKLNVAPAAAACEAPAPAAVAPLPPPRRDDTAIPLADEPATP
ncbi:hypothetical protein O0L34_g4177 [Tuta absoluta]|nr:hypothetical protein O0L34_g4177 [Tuta absoluta]KAJ2951926.1 hypothetical protein O0L34_g4177 [Tuta absoluta]